MEKLLVTLLEEFHAELSTFDGSVARQVEFPEVSNKIMVAIGMRRTGKTYFLMQNIKKLIAQSVPLTSILYINFEDDRLLMESESSSGEKKEKGNLIHRVTLQSLLDAFYSLYPENHERKIYLFLDEIQNVAEWPIVIRRFFDTKDVQIFLSGSSSKLLSKEIATSLRGRSMSAEVWPYSFSEYLSAHGLSYPKRPMGQKALDNVKKQFLNYLVTGGFPEITPSHSLTNYYLLDNTGKKLLDNTGAGLLVHPKSLSVMDRNRLLRDYVDVVVFRDIVERHKITNLALIKYLIRTLIANTACLITVNKLFNDLKSQGFQVGKSTLYDYMSYIEDAYLAFTVPLYTKSIRKAQVNPRKVYIVDSGIYNAYVLEASSGYGHLLENLVYLDLRRKGYDIYYYQTRSGYEVDFFAKGLDGGQLLYQVVWDMHNEATYKREVRALEEAEKELGIKGKIITADIYLNG